MTLMRKMVIIALKGEQEHGEVKTTKTDNLSSRTALVSRGKLMFKKDKRESMLQID